MRNLVLPLVLGVAGCNAVLGIDDHSLAPASAPIDSGEDSTEPDPGDGGPDVKLLPDADVPDVSLPDASTDGGCTVGNLRCNGNTPQKCVGGAWQDQSACGGSTPVCSNGVCGSFRTTGGVRSTAPVATPAADGGARLVSGGFEFGARSCSAQGMCVSGGIVP